jgi:hypothetical protein
LPVYSATSFEIRSHSCVRFQTYGCHFFSYQLSGKYGEPKGTQIFRSVAQSAKGWVSWRAAL